MNESKNQRILVVDDNAAIHEDFRKILCAKIGSAELDSAEAALFGDKADRTRRLFFEVESAYQGKEALALVEKAKVENKPYAMAFVDVRMPPGWDGIETTSRLWEVDGDLQIVICTAFSDHSWDEMLLKLGHSDRLLILKKPFDNIEVLQLANALTEKWRLLQETKSNVAQLEMKVNERTESLQEANKNLKAEIIERQQVEAALRESQETILRQERLAVVGQLAAGVAHEFNNILTVIQGHAGLILTYPNQKQNVLDSAREIVQSSERAANLTRQMLTFSRKQIMRTKVLNLVDLVNQLTKTLNPVLSHTISVSCQHAPGLPNIRADASMMDQLLLNLTLNARDAMPQGGELAIATRLAQVSEEDAKRHPDARPGMFVCLSVADTGHGMDEKTLKRIFEPFFTTKEVGKGTGLGLATVYGIVRQHEGWIEVTSAPQEGATFKVFLPASG